MATDYDVKLLKELVKKRDIDSIKKFMNDNDLILVDNMIQPRDVNFYKNREKEYDIRQFCRKINLNSLYGSMLEASSVFFDFRLGSSTTLGGRMVVKHLTEKANEFLAGTYDLHGASVRYNDTDSKVPSAKQFVKENGECEQITVEELYNRCIMYSKDNRTGKEYGFTNIEVLSYDVESDKPIYYPINYVYRHKTSKPKWELEDEIGNINVITNDHSCMVERDGKLITVKPEEILNSDILLSIKGNIEQGFNLSRNKVKRCECIGNFDNEYVYDIGINHPVNQWEFSNNVLLHNSVYVSIDTPEFRKMYPTFDYNNKDLMVKFADAIGDKINESFPEYMMKTFNCTKEQGELQKAGREVVASKGYWVSKKRYALMVFEKEGERLDIHGKPGKLKVMGLQTQRSDTPKNVRAMLKDMIHTLLTTSDQEELLNHIRRFRDEEWAKLPPWLKGSPKAANNIDKFEDELSRDIKARVPGHVMASINWNRMIDINSDKKSPKILSGGKTIVCKLRDNNWGMTSIAYPVDIERFPKWFTELPFAEQGMTGSVVDKTLESVFGALKMGLTLRELELSEFDTDGILFFD